MSAERATIVPLPVGPSLWQEVFLVAPLVLVGTRDPDGVPDLAPKSMAMPLGWSVYFGFVCTPSHATYRNAVARGAFTVSYPTPDQIVATSLSATQRDPAGAKLALAALETFPARVVDGLLVAGAGFFLECELDRVVDGLDGASLVVGRVVAAAADERALRSGERDDADVVFEQPLLAYLAPGRFARIDESDAFPFPSAFAR